MKKSLEAPLPAHSTLIGLCRKRIDSGMARTSLVFPESIHNEFGFNSDHLKVSLFALPSINTPDFRRVNAGDG